MAKKGPKPCYRITRLNDRYQITAYPVVGRSIVMAGQVEAGLGDRVELRETALALIIQTRQRFTSQEK